MKTKRNHVWSVRFSFTLRLMLSITSLTAERSRTPHPFINSTNARFGPCIFANDQNDRNAKLFDGRSSDSTVSTISKDDSNSLAGTSVLKDESSRNVHEGARLDGR